jgi:hypothetical protein
MRLMKVSFGLFAAAAPRVTNGSKVPHSGHRYIAQRMPTLLSTTVGLFLPERPAVIIVDAVSHRQLTTEQQVAAGESPDVARILIGIEDADELTRDLDRALTIAHG